MIIKETGDLNSGFPGQKIRNGGQTQESAEPFNAALQQFVNRGKAPYSHMARGGLIQYKGVIFVCDYERNALCLGDVSNPKEVLNISLSGGGVLKVNRDNLGDLARAIGMFSPEDINRIMRAIAQDTQCSRKRNEIEEMRQNMGKKEQEDEKAE